MRKDLIRGEWVMCDQKWPCEWNKESGQQCFDDGATIYAPGQQWDQADIALDNISDTCLSSNSNGSSIEMGERLKVSVALAFHSRHTCKMSHKEIEGPPKCVSSSRHSRGPRMIHKI